MILHLGVVELPYSQAPTRHRKASAGTLTTGDVAEFLEQKYHIMEVFSQIHGEDIGDELAKSLVGTMESLLMGAPTGIDPFGAATSAIEDRFKKFLSLGEMDRLGYPGVPTQAAIDRASGKRRSARFKRARPSNGPPVSFIDSGLYESSFKAWVDG